MLDVEIIIALDRDVQVHCILDEDGVAQVVGHRWCLCMRTCD